jgi:hypothetical protein
MMYVPRIAIFWAQWRRTVIAMLATAIVALIGWLAGLEGRLLAAITTLVAILTSAFGGIIALIGLIPWLGPLVLKALSIPFLWIMNGAGYFTAIFLMRQGHSKAVLDSRILTYMLITGLVLGYILGKLI